MAIEAEAKKVMYDCITENKVLDFDEDEL